MHNIKYAENCHFITWIFFTISTKQKKDINLARLASPGQPLAEIVTTIKNYIWSPHSFPQVVRLYRNEVNILDNHVCTTEMH